MLTFVEKYGYNITSQNGENGIIEEILKRIILSERKAGEIHIFPDPLAVEIGAPTKQFCSNIYPLPEPWLKLWFDIDPKESGIQKIKVTPENINNLFYPPNLLSIDIDNDDYHIWAAYAGSPDIVVIEINSSIPPMTIEIPGDRGASYRAMVELGLSKGYSLLCHTGNLVFIRMKHLKLFPEVDNYSPIGHWEKFFNKSFL